MKLLLIQNGSNACWFAIWRTRLPFVADTFVWTRLATWIYWWKTNDNIQKSSYSIRREKAFVFKSSIYTNLFRKLMPITFNFVFGAAICLNQIRDSRTWGVQLKSWQWMWNVEMRAEDGTTSSSIDKVHPNDTILKEKSASLIFLGWNSFTPEFPASLSTIQLIIIVMIWEDGEKRVERHGDAFIWQCEAFIWSSNLNYLL